MLYETIRGPDINAGDWVQQSGWVSDRGEIGDPGLFWEVQKVEGAYLTIFEHTQESHGLPNPISSDRTLKYPTGDKLRVWYRLIKELPYDPAQQGDRDDDI
jgi:hypothetical protein